MTSVLSNDAANSALDYLLRPATKYLSLHTSDPGPLGDFDSEASGGDYERQPTTFTVAGSRSSGNVDNAIFANMPAGTVTHVGIWTAVTGGNMIASKNLTTPIVVAEGDTFKVPATAVVVTFP